MTGANGWSSVSGEIHEYFENSDAASHFELVSVELSDWNSPAIEIAISYRTRDSGRVEQLIVRNAEDLVDSYEFSDWQGALAALLVEEIYENRFSVPPDQRKS